MKKRLPSGGRFFYALLMRAAVLTIGTEVTRGELINSNAAWLGEALTELGFHVVEHISVEDEMDVMLRTLQRLCADVDLVITTGGLGPTTDDLTRQAVAKLAGVELLLDPASLEAIRRRWVSRGREMPVSNQQQALVPQGADIIANAHGTAPGFKLTVRNTTVLCMPGVPSEMKGMFEDEVHALLAPWSERTSHQVHLRTFGLPESELADRLADVEPTFPGITLGYRAHFPEIEVKIKATRAALSPDVWNGVEALCAEVEKVVRERLGDHVYGGRDERFAGVLGGRLRDKGWTLAVAESCTGGLIGAMLTEVPGSSDYLLMDTVCYSNASKTTLLGVREDSLRAHGAVSEEVAVQMAEGALRVSGADVAVSVTGIAGPGGATESKPVGTVWFAVARADGEATITKHKVLPGDRRRVQELAAYIGLHLVGRATRD